MCFCLCACGKETEPGTEPETEPTSNVVELNSDNITQYLGMKIHKSSETSPTKWKKIEFYPLQGGVFANAEVVLSCNLSPGYILDIVGGEVEAEDERSRITFLLPADGRYEIELQLNSHWYERIELDFQSASGTFTPVK